MSGNIAMCDMCLETKETTHFDLYISGSEGTRLCHDCEMLVVEFIREQARAALRMRRAEHIAGEGGGVRLLKEFDNGQ